MDENLRKEEHPRFHRAKDAREPQRGEGTDDVSKMEDEEIIRATKTYLRQHPEEEEPDKEATSSKRKCGDDEEQHGKAQKRSSVPEE